MEIHAIPGLDVTTIGALLIAAGLLTMWLGNTAGAATPGTSYGDFHRPATPGDMVARLNRVLTALQGGVSARRMLVPARRMVPARARAGTRAAPAAAEPARLSVDRQLEALTRRIDRSIDGASTSRRLHTTAERKLDAAEYALGQLKAELAAVIGRRPETAKAAAYPRSRPGVEIRPASQPLPQRLAA